MKSGKASRLETTRILARPRRPAIVEAWLDRDTQTLCRTVFYSMVDAESWDEIRRYQLLLYSGMLEDKSHPSTPAGIVKVRDHAGHEMWSVTVTMADDK